MAKTNMLCPFSHKLCDECAVYRGRHYYLSLCKNYRGYLTEPKKKAKPVADHYSIDSEALKRSLEPWTNACNQLESVPEVTLRVIDMESGKARICQLDEARTWDWNNPETLRLIDGYQITGWDVLIDVLSYKSSRGWKEVNVYEGPRFMLLGGG